MPLLGFRGCSHKTSYSSLTYDWDEYAQLAGVLITLVTKAFQMEQHT